MYKEENVDLKRNGEGYPDPTAYEAIRRVEGGNEEDNIRFYKLLHTIFHVCELAGFSLEGRITLVDNKTGRAWK